MFTSFSFCPKLSRSPCRHLLLRSLEGREWSCYMNRTNHRGWSQVLCYGFPSEFLAGLSSFWKYIFSRTVLLNPTASHSFRPFTLWPQHAPCLEGFLTGAIHQWWDFGLALSGFSWSRASRPARVPSWATGLPFYPGPCLAFPSVSQALIFGCRRDELCGSSRAWTQRVEAEPPGSGLARCIGCGYVES